MDAGPIARVQPLTRTRAVRGPFDYRLGPEHAGVGVGSVLRVRFGGQRTLAVVVERTATSAVDPERLLAPDGVLHTSLPADLVALAHWMAAEYCSTPARALSLLLAPGSAGGMRAREVLLAAITDAGRMTLADGGARLTDRQRALLTALADSPETVAATLDTPALRRLEGRGLVRMWTGTQRRVPRRFTIDGAAARRAPTLSGEQAEAVARIEQAVGAVEPGRLLLHGVTGSGKTEVYLSAVEAVLARGRSAIVLVPEIALTPQALERFRARLGEVVAVIHSGLAQGERFDEWERCRRGEARVCVGPRSAVFAPLTDLGLIVVDEEHESSYKHEGDPRYDARHVAARRAADHRALLLLGSATPRPESTLDTPRLRLTRRVDGATLPPVEILDMRGHHHPLHPETQAALAGLRRSGGKAIILLNRRGWSNFLSCRACGEVWMCPNCDVALVLHRSEDLVACHHCGYRERVPKGCRNCGSVAIARHGAGTERIQHDLAEALGDPDFPILRLDADAAGLAERATVLETFAAARGAILVGTQMVAKGHDFPGVALGVVLDADATLRFPDFRAEERTFALIAQLAGRAGRASGAAPGPASRVLVQTLAPDARSIAFAARHDSDGFLADELARRAILGYPPYASLIRVVVSAIDAPLATRAAAALHARIAAPEAQLLGPAPLFRLRGRERRQIVIKAADRAGAIAAVGAAVDGLADRASRRGVSISVDVDPQ